MRLDAELHHVLEANYFGEPAVIACEREISASSIPNSVEVIQCGEAFYTRARDGSERLSQVDEATLRLATARLIPDAAFDPMLFPRLHDAVRSIDGLHADEALDELCKMIFLKVLSESDEQFAGIFSLNNYKTAAGFASTIRRASSFLVQSDYASSMPAGTIFLEPVKLSLTALIRVAEHMTYLIFDGHADLSGELFQRLIASAVRQGMGQYFTPLSIVEMAIRILAPKPGESILDPFCGSAQFLVCADRFARADSTPGNLSVTGVEKSARMARVAVTDCVLADLPASSIVNDDSLFPTLNAGWFRRTYDCVATNPPFGALIDFRYFKSAGFTLQTGARTALEIVGLERSVSMLRDGGRLAIVVPDSLLDGKRALATRHWIDSNLEIIAIIGLPDDAFAGHGALHKTSLFVAQKIRKHLRGNRHVFLGELATTDPAEVECMTQSAISFIAQESWAHVV